MANALDDIDKALRLLKDRGAEMAAFEATLEQISSSLADLVAIIESRNPAAPGPAEAKLNADAMANAFRPLLAALPAPEVVVNAPVNVTTGKAGDTWRITSKRPDGTDLIMTVTRM
jgi:F420-dependent methylenetetrahydromethanopterin dehydrogenase